MPNRSQSHVTQARGKTDLVRSIRAMPIKLVRCSKDNSNAAQDMAQEWLTKLSRQVCMQTMPTAANRGPNFRAPCYLTLALQSQRAPPVGALLCS